MGRCAENRWTMNGKTKGIVWFCLMVILPLTIVTAGEALTLEELVTLALQNDAQSQAESLAARAGGADGWGRVAQYGPTLRGAGRYMRSRDSLRTNLKSGQEERVANFTEPELTVSFEQPLVDFEKGATALQGLVDVEISELGQRKARDDLLLKVYERYYAVIARQRNLELAESEGRALEKQLEAARARLELGFGTITDVHNAEARYRLSQAATISRRTEVENGVRALEELVDRKIAGMIDGVPDSLPLPVLNGDDKQWLTFARKNNTDLLIKQLQAESRQFEYRAAQSRFLPSLVLFADYAERSPDGGLLGLDEDRSETDVGLRIDMDLLAGGRDCAATAAASLRARSAREQVAAAEQALKRSVDSLLATIEQTRELVSAYQSASVASRLALEATEASYDEGGKVLLDVLNAQQDYYRSLREYQTNRYRYMELLDNFTVVVGIDRDDPVLVR